MGAQRRGGKTGDEKPFRLMLFSVLSCETIDPIRHFTGRNRDNGDGRSDDG